MRILRIPAYCFPEKTASAHLEQDRYEAFSRAGHDLIIYTPTPTRGLDQQTYEEYKTVKQEKLHDGHVIINRFAAPREPRNALLRAVRYVWINVVQYFKSVATPELDVIYGGSTPPTQGVLCGLIKKRLSKKYKKNVPFVYNLQDVFPDSLVTTGMTHEGSFLWKIGRKVEDYTYKCADVIIVISQSMKENIMKKGVPEEKIRVVSNWIDTDAVRPVEKENNRLYEEFGIDKEKFTVVYAGNFGAAQGAQVVLEAAKLLPDIQFVIFGGGSGFEEAKKQAESLPNVIVNGLLPQDRVPEVYSLGNVALITCKKGVGSSGMPSKTWSIMACNTPIVAAFDTDSELARIIREANAGICVEPEDPQALAEAIAQKERHTGGRDYVCKHASKQVCVGAYVDALEQVCKK